MDYDLNFKAYPNDKSFEISFFGDAQGNMETHYLTVRSRMA